VPLSAGGSGTCIDVNTQSCPGELAVGLCSGPDNVKCCLTDFGAGYAAGSRRFGSPVAACRWGEAVRAAGTRIFLSVSDLTIGF
jgi:hypothetical protein